MENDIFLKKKKFKVIAIDLDGTIAEYGWRGDNVIGKPLPGAKEFLKNLKKLGWSIIIYTTRWKVSVVRRYCRQHGLVYDKINKNIYKIKSSGKVIADIYLDDRALKFNGNYKQSLKDIREYKVWYARKGRKL